MNYFLFVFSFPPDLVLAIIKEKLKIKGILQCLIIMANTFDSNLRYWRSYFDLKSKQNYFYVKSSQ
jgi:hypothetical protein